MIGILLFLLIVIGIGTFVRSSLRSQGSSDTPGDNSGLLGVIGEAQETFSAEGSVMVRGELWRATTPRGIVEKGAKVKVVSLQEPLTLVVVKVDGAGGNRQP